MTVYNAVHDCVIKRKACQSTLSAFYNAAGLNTSSPKSEQQGETQDPNAFMDLFSLAILNKTTMSSISYCKAVTGSGQTLVNGKGQEEEQEKKKKFKTRAVTRYSILLFHNCKNHH